MSEEPKSELEHSELGIKIHRMEGWQFWSRLLRNLDTQESKESRWMVACQAGIHRSDETNREMRSLGIKVLKKPGTNVLENQGIPMLQLPVYFLRGDYDKKTSLIRPYGYKDDDGFNKLLIFANHEKRFDENFRDKVLKSLKELAQKTGVEKFTGIEIYIVDELEMENSNIINEVERERQKGTSNLEIADLIEKKFQ